MGIVSDLLRPGEKLIDKLLKDYNGHITGENIEPRSLGPDLLKPHKIANALPAAPTNGQVVYYQEPVLMAANGQVWALKYRADALSGSRWEFIGGSSLFVESAPAVATASDVYVGLAGGPALTLPLGGDYYVQIGARMHNDTANSGAVMSYDIGATPAVDADYISCFATVATVASSQARTMFKGGLAAGTVLTAKFKRNAPAGNANFEHRFIHVTPIRIT